MNYVMSIFIIALTATISFGFNGKEIQKSSLDDKLTSFLESLKPIVQTGDGTLGFIPIFDPFTTKYQKINFSEDKFNIVGDLRDVKVYGLSDYNINNARFKLAGLKITLNITWPSIQYKSLYNLDAKFDDWEGFGLFGDGNVRIHVTNFTFGVIAQLGIKSNKVFVKKLSTGLSLEAIKFVASGIYNNEEASESINAIVSSTLPYALETYQWLIVGEINVLLKNLINSYLHDFINIIMH